MGVIIRNILVRVGANVNPLQQGMQQAQSTMRQFQSNMGATTSGIQSSSSAIGGMLTKIGGILAAAFAVNKLVQFSKSSMDLASNLNEVQNVVDVTFGSMSSQINTFAQNAITQFGLSELSAKKYASTLGAMFKSSGINGQQLTEMSERMTGLAADLASFYNISQDEAFGKIQSGISGEVEPLRQLGVNMSVANMQAYALSQGITTSYQSMTQAQQTLLRYNYLLSVTKDAQGDFSRTSGSWANQLRLLNQQWDIMKITVGQGLINAFTPLLSVINAVVARLQVLATYFKAFTEALFGSAGASSSLAAPTASAASGMDAMGAAADKTSGKIKKAASAAKGALGSFDKLNTIGKQNGSGADLSGLDGSAGGIDLGSIGKSPTVDTSSLDSFKDKVKGFANEIKATFASIGQFIQEHKTGIISAIAGIVAAFAAFAIITNWTGIVAAFSAALTALSTALGAISIPALAVAAAIGIAVAAVVDLWQTNKQFRDSVIQVWTDIKATLSKIADDTWQIIKQTWSKYGGSILKGLQDFWNNTKQIILDAWNSMVRPIIEYALKAFSDLWDKHLKGLVLAIADFIGKLIDDALQIYNGFIAPVVDWLIKNLGPAFVNAVKIIIDVISTIVGTLSDVAKGIFEILGGIIDFVTGVFTGNWSKAWQGIKEVFGGIWDGISGLFKGAINLVIDGINAFTRTLNWIPTELSKVPGFDWAVNFKIPTIPKLAVGGLAFGPTLAMIGDNHNARTDPEVISPLSKLQSMINQSLSNSTGSGTVNNHGGPTTVVLEINESELGRATIKAINSVHRQVGMTLLSV